MKKIYKLGILGFIVMMIFTISNPVLTKYGVNRREVESLAYSNSDKGYFLVYIDSDEIINITKRDYYFMNTFSIFQIICVISGFFSLWLMFLYITMKKSLQFLKTFFGLKKKS
ncbi:hypothetical protein [Spirochaeta cellobiosiphila]|uniref:hypothetical protein n=1 Tax=Spirochaeta cellobiosiphila TaxID=504483 RepID=UPI0004064E86|nr:hypothetical protein [Spirochaeta cellobiosiphila]